MPTGRQSSILQPNLTTERVIARPRRNRQAAHFRWQCHWQRRDEANRNPLPRATVPRRRRKRSTENRYRWKAGEVTFLLEPIRVHNCGRKKPFLPVFRVSHRIVNKSSAERTAEAVDVLLGGGFIGRYIEIFYDRAYVSCGYVDDTIGAWRPNDKANKERHHAYHEADIKFLSRALGHER